MSNMPKPTLIAVLCSDLHLTLQRPACRDDKDWLDVQAGYLKQLRTLAHRRTRFSPDHEWDIETVPIICAGDIFDRWNVSPELINFALKHLPDGMICVPGQHDLPNHRMDAIHRSGYGVLAQAGKIKDISGSTLASDAGFAAYGFGWEEEIEPLDPNNEQRPGAAKAILHVAVIHRYMWSVPGTGYPGSPEKARLYAFKKQLRGYDVAVVGDNHIHFTAQAGECQVFNCGGFIRRKSDEIDRRPAVGLLYSDGTVKTHFLDTSGDKFHADVQKREEIPVNMKEFIDSLEGLGEQGLDFREAVRQHLRNDDLKKPVKRLIEEIMGKV